MANKMSKEGWENKERRELFCKAVNSMLMTTPDKPLEEVLKASKTIVDTAFENYSLKNNKVNIQDAL